MRATFPALADEVEEVGRIELAKALQTTEALVFVESVIPELQQLGIPALTVHDSILCPVSSADVAKECIEASIETFTDMSPTISIETNDPERREGTGGRREGSPPICDRLMGAGK